MEKFYVRFAEKGYFRGMIAFESMADLLQGLDMMKVELEAGKMSFVIYEGDRRTAIFSGGFKKHQEGGINLIFEVA